MQFGYISPPSSPPLYAAYHPALESPAPAVLIAAPLFEERKSAYAPLRRLAEKLAGAGAPVLRFDYRGSGESAGECATLRWADLIQDLGAARDALLALSRRREFALLGLRLGGTLALQNADALGARCVVALAPIPNGSAQVRLWKMRSKIRAELTAEYGKESPAADATPAASTGNNAGDAVIDFDGFAVHPKFFDDVAAIELARSAPPLACTGLIVQLSHRTDAAPESAQLIARLGAHARLECLRIEPFWDKLDDVDTTPVETLVLAQIASAGNAER